MSDNISIKLTNSQANLLVQAAIFSCCTDITADWSNEDLGELVSISKLLESKIDDLDLSRLQAYMFRDKSNNNALVFEDEYSQDVMNYFDKNIKIMDVSNEMSYTSD